MNNRKILKRGLIKKFKNSRKKIKKEKIEYKFYLNK